MLKHVGKMKHNGAKVCVIYRTLPGDAYGALVVGSASLSESYHNTLMSEVESGLGQQANELGDHISSRYFQDGTNILEQLHKTGRLIRVATSDVIMTPTMSAEISLDELNVMIAEQKGISLNDLSIKDDMPHVHKTKIENIEIKDISKNSRTEAVEIKDISKNSRDENVSITNYSENTVQPKTAAEYRSEADRLYKEAAKLRKIADGIDPPKKKNSAEKSEKVV
jgi:hypothetical protein